MCSILDRIDDFCDTFMSMERKPKLNSMDEIMLYFANQNVCSEDVLKIFDACYLHLLKLYEDRFENVRERAVELVSLFVEFLKPNDFHSMNIINTLRTRLGQFETVEESEEIRLSLVMQFNKLLQRYVNCDRSDFLPEFYEDSEHILVKVLRDKYPKVQQEACNACIFLGKISKDMEFRELAEKLCTPIFSLLIHKHSSIRTAAVEASGYLALHVDPSKEKLKLILMSISPSLMDSVTTVRRQCGETGTMLLTKLQDRYSFFEHILPLVLCCLKDDSDEVIKYVQPLWIKCGQHFYEENETELSDQELGDMPAKNYPKNLTRPTIGCRGLVQRCLRLVHLILRESNDWKESVRLHSFKLLYQFILHAEAALTAKFFEFYRDLARGCYDNDSTVAAEAMKCADLLGCLLRYEDWFQHGYDGLRKNPKEGYLRCFYHMFKNANDVPLYDLVRVAHLFVQPEFSHSFKATFQILLLKFVRVIFEKSELALILEEDERQTPENLERLDESLYVVTVKILALTTDLINGNPADIKTLGECMLVRIAERERITVGSLHEKYFLYAVDGCSELDLIFDRSSEPIMLLTGLIYVGKFRAHYMQQLQRVMLQVFEHSTNCAKIKLMTVLAVVMLDWNRTINTDFEINSALLENFVVAVVEPHLQWSAGGAAETLRSIATNTLCSVTQNAYNESKHFLPKYAKVLVVLLEDYSVATRQNALRTLINYCALEIEDLKPLAYGVLQRLDDPSSAIRGLACIVLTKLRIKNASDNKIDIWHTFVTKAIDMLILHYEGQDKKYRDSCKDALIYFAKEYSEQARDCLKRSESMIHDSASVKLLKKYLGQQIDN